MVEALKVVPPTALPGCPDSPPSEWYRTREPDVASQSAEGARNGTSMMPSTASDGVVSDAEIGHRVDIVGVWQ